MNNQLSLNLFFILFLCFVGLYLSFSDLDKSVFSRKSESRTAVVSREMLQKDDYLLPTINDVLRLKKTPLYYWMITGFSNHDAVISHAEARIPSVIAGIFSAALLMVIFSRYFSFNQSYNESADPVPSSFRMAWILLSGLILIAMPGFMNKMRHAEAESLLTLFTLLSMTPLIAHLKSPSRFKVLLAYVLSGIGFLVKGPILLAFVWPAYYIVNARKLRYEKGVHLLGIILMLLLALSWFIAILTYVPNSLEVFSSEIGMRFHGGAPHQEPQYFYFYQIFVSAFPFSLLLPFALFHAWKNYEYLSVRYLIWVFVVGFVLLNLLTTKQMHYLMPLFPIMSLILTLYLRDLATMSHQPITRWIQLLIKLVVFLLTLLMLLLMIFSLTEKQWLYTIVFMLTSVAGIYYLISKPKQYPMYFTAWSILTIFGLILFLNSYQVPIQSEKESLVHFVSAVRDQYPDSKVVTDMFDSRLFYYYGKHLPVKSSGDIRQLLDKQDVVYVISKKDYSSFAGIQAEKISSISGSIGERLFFWKLNKPTESRQTNDKVVIDFNEFPIPDKSHPNRFKQYPSMLVTSIYLKDSLTVAEFFQQLKTAGQHIAGQLVPLKVLYIRFPEKRQQSWLNEQLFKIKKSLLKKFIHKYGFSDVFSNNTTIKKILAKESIPFYPVSEKTHYRLQRQVNEVLVSQPGKK